MLRHASRPIRWTCAAILALTPGLANGATLSTEPLQFAILSQDLREVLTEFGSSVGVSMMIGEGVQGRVGNFRGKMPAEEFLERMTQAHGLSWYFDGNTIHITPVSEDQSVVVDFRAVPPALLSSTLDALAVSDPRFDLRTTDDSSMGIVTGPPRYIELVKNAFTMLEARQVTSRPDAPTRTEPRRASILVVRGGSAHVWTGRNDVGPIDAADTPPPETAPSNPTE